MFPPKSGRAMAIRHPFLNRFWNFVQENRLILPNQKIVVAVSGGVDSVVLLHCLSLYARAEENELAVAHFHHGLRGPEADADRDFVAGLARKYGLPFFWEKADVAQFAREQGLSVEEAGRELRYRFLEDLSEQLGADLIATGHHASDQAETVLYRAARGSGWRGLGGIPLRRGKIIRPLLFAFREEIEEFARVSNLDFRIDRSNFSLDYRRNVIRHKVLPLLKQNVNAGAEQHLAELAGIFREGDEFLWKEARRSFEECVKQLKSRKITLEKAAFCGYFKIIQKYVLLHAAERLQAFDADFSARKLNLAVRAVCRGQAGRRLFLGGNWILEVGAGHFSLFQAQEAPRINLPFEPGRELRIPELGLVLRSEIVPCSEVAFSRNPLTEFADLDALKQGPLRIRSVRPGDHFVPLGMKGHQKVSDFFVNQKIPRVEREHALVLECGNEIAWLIGFRLDDRFKVRKNSKQCVRLSVAYD